MSNEQILINLKQIIKFSLLLILPFTVSSCKLMPYKNDFDCPVPKGLQCKSLYEINKLADQGIFDSSKHDNLIICCDKKHKITPIGVK